MDKFRTDNDMAIHNILSIVPAVISATTYLVLSFAEGFGMIDALSAIDKFGGAGLAGIVAYFVIRYLLRNKEKQDAQIQKMHEERLEAQAKHQRELIEMLRENMVKK